MPTGSARAGCRSCRRKAICARPGKARWRWSRCPARCRKNSSSRCGTNGRRADQRSHGQTRSLTYEEHIGLPYLLLRRDRPLRQGRQGHRRGRRQPLPIPAPPAAPRHPPLPHRQHRQRRSNSRDGAPQLSRRVRVLMRDWLNANSVVLLTGRQRRRRHRLCIAHATTHWPCCASRLPRSMRLDLVVNTHCHSDHMGGNALLARTYRLPDRRSRGRSPD